MTVSIIITYHEEGIPFLMECLSQLERTININDYEIIVVDDGSKVPVTYNDVKSIANCGVIRVKNAGVGQAFDMGVRSARGKYLFIMACDIRFTNNGWAAHMLNEVIEYPKALISSSCIGFNQVDPDGMNFDIRRKKSNRGGAEILLFHDKLNNPKKEDNFRDILQAKWLPFPKGNVMSYEIPCVLGAFYGISKSWYEHIMGFTMHHLWGGLEPYISLKSWMFGGSCRIIRSCEIAHIFKTSSPHGIPIWAISYNKLLIARTLFDEDVADKLDAFLGDCPHAENARKRIANDAFLVASLREEYKKKTVVNVKELCEKLNIDTRGIL